MARIVLSLPSLGDMVLYQSGLVLLGFLGGLLCYRLISTITDEEWREAASRFPKALILFSSLELAELTEEFWNYELLAITAEAFIITYIVYGVLQLRLLIDEHES